MPNLQDKKKPSGPVKLKNGWIIEVDRQACIGAATCVAIAPDSYDLDDEAKAVIIEGIKRDTEQKILAGAKSCPVDAIVIKDKTGKRIYPK